MKSLIKIIFAVSLAIIGGIAHAAPSIELSLNASTITSGDSAVLSWNATDATSCTGTGFDTKGETRGSVIVSPSENTTYSIECTGPGPEEKVCTGARDGILFEFDGWVSTDASGNKKPMCSQFDIYDEVCGRANYPGCTIENIDYQINSGNYCRVTGQKCNIVASSVSGTASASLVVQERVPEPVVELIADPTNIIEGNSSTLRWSSTNASACYSNDFSIPSGVTNGSLDVSPREDTTYNIRCDGDGGSDRSSASVSVSPAPSPPAPAVSASLHALPSSIVEGSTSELTWSSQNASACSGTGFSTGGSIRGSLTISPSSTSNYSITCTGEGGSDTDSARVEVETQVEPPTVSLSANPSNINNGDSSVLTWSSTNATRCTSGDFVTNDRTSGSITVTPNSSKLYGVTCYSSSDRATATQNIQVTSVDDPSDPSDPDPRDPSDPTDPTPDPTGPDPRDPSDPEPTAGPQDCLINGTRVSHGSSIQRWREPSRTFDQSSCRSEQRICNDGVLSGSYGFSTCVEQGPIPISMECSTDNQLFRSCEGLFRLRDENSKMYVRTDSEAELFYQCGPRILNGYQNGQASSNRSPIVSVGEEVTATFGTPRLQTSEVSFSYTDTASRSDTNEMSFCLNAEDALDLRETFLIKVLNFSFSEE